MYVIETHDWAATLCVWARVLRNIYKQLLFLAVTLMQCMIQNLRHVPVPTYDLQSLMASNVFFILTVFRAPGSHSQMLHTERRHFCLGGIQWVAVCLMEIKGIKHTCTQTGYLLYAVTSPEQCSHAFCSQIQRQDRWFSANTSPLWWVAWWNVVVWLAPLPHQTTTAVWPFLCMFYLL
jgi:hypothetical protein